MCSNLSLTPCLTSASQRVLSTPELVAMIFSSLSISCNAKNAAVCSLWSEVALDAVWYDLDDLYPLLNVLAPIQKIGDELVSLFINAIILVLIAAPAFYPPS